MNRQQARLVDRIQAAKVQLAIRWRMDPADISDRRTMFEMVIEALARREEVLGWIRP